MTRTWSLVALLAATTSTVLAAGPIKRDDPPVTVTVPAGYNYQGGWDQSSNMDRFRGIRYAQPPVGNLRFAKPAPFGKASSTNATQVVTGFGPGCLQPINGQPVNANSEDCLFLSILRPHGISATAKLPVMFWIYGGAFMYGDLIQYDGTALVKNSVTRNQPVIYVHINYRLSSFGFLSSDAVASDSSATLNAAYYDQRAALQWVHDNIASFGGDPTKVTIFGQSVGGTSIVAQMLANKGNTGGLFRAAIMQSAAGFPIDTPTSRNSVYQKLLTLTNCSNIACLRGVDANTLLTVTKQMMSDCSVDEIANKCSGGNPFIPVLDPFFLPSHPRDLIRTGGLPQIPFIAGNNLDEGAGQIPQNLNSDADLKKYLPALIPHNTTASTDSLISNILSLYPDDPTVGSPYRPEDLSPPVANTERFFGATNQYKRIASIFGDLWFQCLRRQLLQTRTQNFGYLYTQPLPWFAAYQGVPHAAETPITFGQITDAPYGPLSAAMSEAWIAFANTLSPNGPGLVTWPAYGTALNMMQFQINKTFVITDNYRTAGIKYFIDHGYDLGH